jgi:hypothetical protein
MFSVFPTCEKYVLGSPQLFLCLTEVCLLTSEIMFEFLASNRFVLALNLGIVVGFFQITVESFNLQGIERQLRDSLSFKM